MRLIRLLVLFLLLCLIPLQPVAADSTAATSGGTFASDNTVGTVAWVTPSNAASSDNSRATAAIGDTATSEYLKATNFGFSIPAGATINGIIIEYECHDTGDSGGALVVEGAIKLVKSGTIQGNDNGNDGTTYPHTSGAESYLTEGTSSDLWGITWTTSDVNASNFGVVISAKPRSGFEQADAVALIDHIRITVHYTTAAQGRRRMILSQTRTARHRVAA